MPRAAERESCADAGSSPGGSRGFEREPTRKERVGLGHGDGEASRSATATRGKPRNTERWPRWKTIDASTKLGVVQLAIPHAPRPVTLRQVPGAMRRVSLVALACLVGVLVVGLGSRLAVRWLTDDARFVAEAERIVGTVVRVDRPAKGASESSTLPVAVIYAFKGQHSATLDVETSLAEPLGKGAPISLLVRAEEPGRPRELGTAEARAGRSSLIMPIVGVAIVAAILVLIRELRRATRREVEPLRTGLLVWLTPDAPLPETKAPFSFAAHYFRDDVKQAVTANADGRRKPVKNGDKVLAAVAPREPTWVRVVDEEVARSLGWYR